MRRWDSICREINKPYFNLVGVGLFSFSYLSLGKAYKYVAKNSKSQVINYDKNDEAVNQYIEFDEVTLDSLPFD